MTTNYPIQRPPSEQLVDLHVYLLPREVWNEKNSSAYNESFSEAVSAGFVRVSRNQTVSDLRMVIEEQLGPDTLPPNYVFLRSVGRRMTQVKPKQELELKCKAFLPPEAWAPEIVVLEPQKDSRGFQTYQSYPGYSPRHDTTQPISGIPTHFPQIANHDRMAPPTDGISQHITHPTLVPGDSPTIHPASIPVSIPASIPAPVGQKLPLPSSHHPNPPPLPYPTHAQNANLADTALDLAQRSNDNYHVAVNQGNTTDSRSKDNLNISANNSASLSIVQPLPNIAHSPNVLVVKSQSGSHLRHPTDEKAKKSHPISSYPADPTNTGFNSNDDTNHVADVASNTNKCTTNVPLGEDVNQGTTPTTSITTGLHHTNHNLYHHHKNIHQSDSRRLSNNDSNSVPFPAPLSATPPDTPTSDTPSPPGHSPMVQQQQQQQGYKGDPLHNMVGIPGKSGRPDAYTNNTNEDSGIAEPTPDDEDPAYERRKSDIDDQYYNQLESGQTDDEPLQHGERRWDQSDRYQEKEIEDERQRQAEIQQREEEKRKEEERRNAERQKEEERRKAERQREEERREHKRKLEQKRQEDAKEQRQREKQKKLEEERRKEEEKRKEEMARKEEEERLLEEEQQQSITDRAGVTDFDGAVPLDEGDDDYDDAAMVMETSQAQDNHGYFVNDEQMRRRAEDELRDYQPQSTWKMDEEGDRETGHLAHPSSRIRSREDTEMELASQQAVQDGLKRVHLTPELHRKAKIGKIRDNSVTDEEDVYETDPEMAGLLEQLQIARQERMKKEKERENVIKRARDLQTKTYERRNRSLIETKPRSSSITPDIATHPRDYWKKRYYDEKKKTSPLEDQGNRIRNQLEVMHRKLLSHIEGKKKGVSVKGPPSKKNDHKINILKMQHELDELRRKVDNSRMKLTSEIKLRNQAEEEVRGLKSEVTQRKINMTLIRNQKLAALKTGENKLLSKTPIPALGQGPMSMSAKR